MKPGGKSWPRDEGDAKAGEAFLGLDDRRAEWDESGPRRASPVAEQLCRKGPGALAVVGKRDNKRRKQLPL